MSAQSPGYRQRAALLLLLVAAIAGSGCSRYTRTKQCRALIAQVNPALDDVITITGTGGAGGGPAVAATVGGAGGAGGSDIKGGTTSGQYMAAAGRYERLAKQLGPMEFSTEDMAKTVAEYAAVMTASAQSLRALGTALESNNYAEAEKANRDLERLSVREHSAIARIDAWCQPGT
ncbi:MAG TPA: hypothetical protein VIK01_09590 [Polyangiaceae bacterium]